MEVPPSVRPEKVAVPQLLTLRKANADLFYAIVRKLTNKQLDELCRQDIQYKFCEDKVFWEQLWYRRNKTAPPVGTLKQIRRAYEEENLLESLVEEISQDKALGRELHRAVYKADQTADSPYADLIMGEEILTDDEETQNRLAEFDAAVEEDFQRHWTRDRIREVLTLTTEVENQEVSEDEEIEAMPPDLVYGEIGRAHV